MESHDGHMVTSHLPLMSKHLFKSILKSEATITHLKRLNPIETDSQRVDEDLQIVVDVFTCVINRFKNFVEIRKPDLS